MLEDIPSIFGRWLVLILPLQLGFEVQKNMQT